VPLQTTRCGGPHTAGGARPMPPPRSARPHRSAIISAPYSEPVHPPTVAMGVHADVTRALVLRRQVRKAKEDYLDGLQRQPNTARAKAKHDAFIALFPPVVPREEKLSRAERTASPLDEFGEERLETEDLRYVPEMRAAIIRSHDAGMTVDVRIFERVAAFEKSLQDSPSSPNPDRVALSLSLLETLHECTSGLLQRCLMYIKRELRTAVYEPKTVIEDVALSLYSKTAQRLREELDTAKQRLEEATIRSMFMQQQLQDLQNGASSRADSGRSKFELSGRLNLETDGGGQDVALRVQNRHLTAQLEEARSLLKQSNEKLYEFVRKKSDVNPKLVEIVKESHDELMLLLSGRDPTTEMDLPPATHRYEPSLPRHPGPE